jgi:hypothetical protein
LVLETRKLHTLLDLRGSIPTFIHISDGKLHDVNVLDLIEPELGAFYVMDRGYVDFKRLYKFVLAGSFFVTRAKRTSNTGKSRPIRSIAVPAYFPIRWSSWWAFTPVNIIPRNCAASAVKRVGHWWL